MVCWRLLECGVLKNSEARARPRPNVSTFWQMGPARAIRVIQTCAATAKKALGEGEFDCIGAEAIASSLTASQQSRQAAVQGRKDNPVDYSI